MPLKLAFLGSGNGTSFQGLYPLIKEDERFEPSLIISNKDSYFLRYAKALNLHYTFIASDNISRLAFEKKLHVTLLEHEIDYLFLIGFMRILSPWFIHQWPHKTLNIHPSLLPKHKGLMDLQVHQAVVNAKETSSGCSVHWVTEEIDDGDILSQMSCPILITDTAKIIKSKVQALEPLTIFNALEKLSTYKQENIDV